jgi:superfamily II DNA helicase RecQ
MLHCQFIFLTATLPPLIEGQFQDALLLSQPLYIRSLTLRADLEYHAVRIPASSLEEAAARHIQATLQQDWYLEEGPRARALVFVQTRRQADLLAGRLGCPAYYSDSGTAEEKAVVLSQ